MAGITQVSLPSSEPVALADAKNFCKVFVATDDTLIGSLITAARQYIEDCTGLMLAPRNFLQSLDCFPFYPYSREPYGTLYGIGALSLYFGYGPILPTPIPPYGMNMNGRLPFEIVLLGSPVSAIDHITYIDSTGEPQTLLPGQDFVADLATTPARILPMPGGVWPQCTMGANTVQVFFTCGFNQTASTVETVSATAGTTEEGDAVPSPPNQQAGLTFVTGIPQTLYVAILLLVQHWYSNRDLAASGSMSQVPHHLQQLIETNKVFDFSIGVAATL